MRNHIKLQLQSFLPASYTKVATMTHYIISHMKAFSSTSCTIATMALLSICLYACKGGDEEKPNPLDDAEKMALHYYNSLLEGDFKTFANGIVASDLGAGYPKSDRLPDAYRNELADAAGQFAIKEAKKHGGIATIRTIGSSFGTDSITALVNLDLSFGDSTHEEILISMQKVDTLWKMK